MAVTLSRQDTQVFQTERRDGWWIEPVVTVVSLVLFSIYSFWAALQNANFQWGPYLSPFYSPNLVEMFPSAFHWLKFSPAFLVLWIPLGFRASCYFYRRVYYRSFFLSPPSCAVKGATVGNYFGERLLPFVLLNLHRYFLYFAIVLAIFHWWHFAQSLNWQGHPGVGVGSAVILVDAIFLSLYVFSCHSLRHLLGGKLDCFSCSAFNKARYAAWNCQSKFNENHMVYAWVSLFTVGFADFYIRMVASGHWQDFHILF